MMRSAVTTDSNPMAHGPHAHHDGTGTGRRPCPKSLEENVSVSNANAAGLMQVPRAQRHRCLDSI
jgi:hypothetical protein